MKANVAIKEKHSFMVIDLETSLSTPLAVTLSCERVKPIISHQYCLFFHYHDDDDDSMIIMIMMIMMMIEQCNQDGNVGKPDNARDPPSNPSRTS